MQENERKTINLNRDGNVIYLFSFYNLNHICLETIELIFSKFTNFR